MLFRDWVTTQDRNKYGTIDEATQNAILNNFAFRRLGSTPERFAQWFWGDIALYTDQYQSMLRMETCNKTFDPFVSRYFEAQLVRKSSGTTEQKTAGQSSTTRQGTNGRTWAGAAEYTSEDTGNRSGKDNSTVTHESSEDQSSTETPDITRTKTFNGREHTFEKSGEITRHNVGDAGRNYTEESGTDTVRRYTDKMTEDETAGKRITESDNLHATDSRSASKAAPMSAVNIGAVSDEGETAYNTARNGSIGSLNWTSASQYSQESGQTGEHNKQTESYDGYKVSKHETGDGEANYDATEHGHKSSTGIDTTETESYNRYKETGTDTGSETDTETGSRETVGKTTGKGTDTTTGETSEETRNNRHETRREADYTDTQQGTDKAENSGSTSGTTSGSEDSRNRYTGREGLTPQAALQSAINYLQTTSLAARWLFGVLEHNFAAVLDLDFDTEEVDLYE